MDSNVWMAAQTEQSDDDEQSWVKVEGQAVHVGLVCWWHSPDVVGLWFGFNFAVVCVCVWLGNMFECVRKFESVQWKAVTRN